MKLIENQLKRWFGMNLQTALQIVIVMSFTLLIVSGILFSIISLIKDPSVASTASWGFAD